MKLTGFLLVPLLSTSLAMGVGVARAQSRATQAQPTRTRPGVVSTELWARRPTGNPELVPASVRNQTSPTSHVLPSELVTHRTPAAGLVHGLSQLSTHPPVKDATGRGISGRPVPRLRMQQGGEDESTAVPINSLPYADSGYTCNSHNDYDPPCGAPGGPDVVYIYRPQADGCIHASLCGSDFDTELWIADSTGAVVACNDDACGLQSDLASVPLIGGHSYYIIVDGYSNYNCGNYLLHVDECPPPPPPLQCPPNAIAEGEPICGDGYVDNFNGGCNSSPEAFSDLQCTTDSIRICGTYGTFNSDQGPTRDTDWYRFTIGNTTTLHFCATGQYATQIFVIDGSSGCAGASILYANNADANGTACIDASLNGGTYYLFVSTTAFTGVPCGANYYMTVKLDSCPPPPPPPQCPPNAIQEGEPVCQDEYNDTFDAGCNSDPPSFVDLPCLAGTIDVCGTYGTYMFQGLQYRDTDWYRIVVNGTTNLTYTVTGQYATSIYILDGRQGCGNIGLICGNSGGPGQTLTCSATVSAGTYWLFVATSAFSGQPCGGVYTMSVTRDRCPEPFHLTCPIGASQEGEPVCYDGYNDTFNAGCNSDPPSFSNPYGGGIGDQNCRAGTVYVCGTYGTYLYQGLQYRDTDWYRVVINNNSHLTYKAVGEAPNTSIYLLNGTAGCGGFTFVCGTNGGPGDTLTCDAVLSPGTYWLFIATSDFAGVPCGSKYVISVTQEACPQPFRVTCPPGALSENEPVCSDTYVDNFNGGCNSNPPVFTEIPCGDQPVQICGTYGTYKFQGIEFRDTDWYEIEIAQALHVRFCVVGEAPTSIFILNGSGSCAGIVFEAAASGAIGDTICCEADLSPGLHWFFVATSDFDGIPCGSKYLATFYGTRCTGPTPIIGQISNVEARAVSGAVSLHWNAFLLQPADFRVMRSPSSAGVFQQVSDVIASNGQSDFSFIDKSVLPSTEYYYRLESRQNGGDWTLAGAARIVTPSGKLAIHAILPNPSTGNSRIDFELPREANVRIEIFDVSGHRVRVLMPQQLAAAGPASITWDGTSDRGQSLPAGQYYVRLAMDSKAVTHRLVLIR